MPKVSVIVPIYGVEKFIGRCAESLFAQTLDDIEFIFIDDCTPDESMKILNAVIEKNRPRFAGKSWTVRTVRMPANSGQAAVRRHGIQLATGQFVIHCDSDDWVEPDAYQLMYEKAVKEELDIVQCDYYRSDGTSKTLYKSGYEGLTEKEDYFRQLLTYRGFTSIWSKMVRKSLYTENEIMYPQENMWEDFALSVQLFYYAKRIGLVLEPLYYYFTNPASISYSNIDKRQSQLMKNSQLILDFLVSQGLMEKYADEIVFFKYMSRSELVVYTGDKNILRLWRKTYPEVNKTFWRCNEFDFKEKVKFVSIYLGLYKFFYKVKYSA